MSASRRLFFAIWPDATERSGLEPLLRALDSCADGRSVPAANLHMTLAFLGAVQDARLPDLLAVAAAVRWPAARIELDRLAHWPKARLICAEASGLPEGFREDAAQLQRQLRTAGFAIEPRPFRAHVTLRRQVSRPPDRWPPFSGCVWTARALALVESVQTPGGSVYTVLDVRALPD